MQVRTDRWHYLLYKEFGSQPEGQPNLCAYVRRVALNALKFIGLLLIAAAFSIVCGVITLAVNCVTVLLGFGFVLVFPSQNFMKIPFRIRWHGEQKSLACFLTPLWLLGVIVACLWWGFSNNPVEAREILIGTAKFGGWVVGVIVGVVAIVFLIMEFFDFKRNLARRIATGPIGDTYRVAQAYVKARKEGICPFIEFVEPPEPSSSST